MKILEILRLYELDQFTYEQIGQHAGVGKSTVGDVIKRCKQADINYQKAQSMNTADLYAVLYPVKSGPKKVRAEPDFPRYHAEMQASRRKNLEYIWTEEYRVEHPEGYSYSHFCFLYNQWCEQTGKKVVMPQEREPGKELFIDWIGDKVPCVIDMGTGKPVDAHFWVCTLGDSSYPFVEAFPNETQVSWTQAHVDAFKWYGGIPRILVPDNTKTAVIKRTMYDPELNHSYLALANHYALAILPARVRTPRDKSTVESGVGWLETWLLGWLEDKTYFSFEQLNRDFRKRLLELSARDFKERPGFRQSIFDALDKPALRPLPKDPFEPFETKPVKSVPNDYFMSNTTAFIIRCHTLISSSRLRSMRIPEGSKCSMRRLNVLPSIPAVLPEKGIPPRRTICRRTIKQSWLFAPGTAVTTEGSQPASGENTVRFIDGMLKSGPIEEQFYKSCNGILFGFRKKYGDEVLEAACAKALSIQSYTYTTIKNILEKGQYKVPTGETTTKPTPRHENLRTGEWA